MIYHFANDTGENQQDGRENVWAFINQVIHIIHKAINSLIFGKLIVFN